MSLCRRSGCVHGEMWRQCRWAFLSKRYDLHQVTTSRNLSLLAVKEAYVPPLSGVSREETSGRKGLAVQGLWAALVRVGIPSAPLQLQ